MIRAAIYVRVSTDQQAQEGDSIAAQLDALTKYVNDRPEMTLAGEYIDEGISGRKADRDELQRLLADIDAGKIDQVLFTKLDRWFRSVRHYTATQELLDRRGVTWSAIWEPIYDTTTPAGRLIVNQMMSIAQFEAENTSQRIRSVMAYKVSQGEAVTGKTPLGFRIQDKHLVPVPEDAEAVRKIFRKYAECGSLNEAARYARSLGYEIYKQNLKYMLKNKKYVGEHRGNLSYCPAIVDRDLFEDVQRKLSMNVSASAGRVYIFAGLIRCGCCGRRMASVHDAHKGSGYSYYRCPAYYVPPRRCENKRIISEIAMEKYLIAEAQNLARNVQLTAEESRREVRDTEKQRAAIDRKIERLKELFLAEQIDLEEYKRDRVDLEKQKNALLEEAAPPERDLSAINELLAIKDMKTLIEALSASERRYLWRGLIDEIIFFPDRHFEIHFR